MGDNTEFHDPGCRRQFGEPGGHQRENPPNGATPVTLDAGKLQSTPEDTDETQPGDDLRPGCFFPGVPVLQIEGSAGRHFQLAWIEAAGFGETGASATSSVFHGFILRTQPLYSRTARVWALKVVEKR